MTKGKILSVIATVVLVRVIFGVGEYLAKNDFSGDGEKIAYEYSTDTSSWKEFNSPTGKFKAEFPTYPKHEAETIKIPNSELTMQYNAYTSKKADGTVYFVNSTVLPSAVDTSNPETNLERSLNGMVANPGNKLVSSNLTYSNGYRAMDFLIEVNSGFLKGRVVLAEHTVYQIMVAHQGKNYSETDYSKFINSFAIQK
jgi:hypothetical protein